MIGDGIGLDGDSFDSSSSSALIAAQSVWLKGFVPFSQGPCPDVPDTCCFSASFVQGTDIYLNFEIFDFDGVEFSVADALEITIVFKKDITSTTNDLVKVMTDGDIELDAVSDHKFRTLISKENSSLLEGYYVFEAFITLSEDAVAAVVGGKNSEYGMVNIRKKIAFP